MGPPDWHCLPAVRGPPRPAGPLLPSWGTRTGYQYEFPALMS
jgi:hypothetical protein